MANVSNIKFELPGGYRIIETLTAYELYTPRREHPSLFNLTEDDLIVAIALCKRAALRGE